MGACMCACLWVCFIRFWMSKYIHQSHCITMSLIFSVGFFVSSHVRNKVVPQAICVPKGLV